MHNYDNILALLREKGIPVSGSIIQDSGVAGHIFVHVSISRNSENKQVPSNRTLNNARDSLQEIGVKVEFLLSDSQSQDIEAGLRATLLHMFGNEVRNAFMTIESNIAHVWIEPKRILEEVAIEFITQKATKYLLNFNIKLQSLAMITGANFPAPFACLRAIRHLAPVDALGLLRELVDRGFTVPSIDWLKRRLDSMRKKGQIIRLSGDRYALPLSSIRSLGTKKGRDSSDVVRLLALARREK